MKAARWNWRRYVLRGNRTPSYSPRIPLLAIPDIGRVVGQHRSAVWPTKGIQTIGDIFEGGRFLTYEALASAHDLGQGWFVAYSALHQLKEEPKVRLYLEIAAKYILTDELARPGLAIDSRYGNIALGGDIIR
ncbi:hypothetical protein NDU88_001711, partial [Pleurodeles waltl]